MYIDAKNINFNKLFNFVKTRIMKISKLLHFPIFGALKLMLCYFQKVTGPLMAAGLNSRY